MKALFITLFLLYTFSATLAHNNTQHKELLESRAITLETQTLELQQNSCDQVYNTTSPSLDELYQQLGSIYEQLSTIYQNEQDYTNAILYSNKALGIYDKGKNQFKELEMIEKKADIQSLSGKYMEASSQYSEVIHAYKTIILSRIFKKAVSIFKQAAIQHQINGDFMQAIWFHKYAGDAERDMGNMHEANEQYTLAAQEFEKHGMKISDTWAPGDASCFYSEVSDLYAQLHDQSKSTEMQSRASELPRGR